MADSYAPRAWDGSGHYALAQIYTDQIFPAVSGWTWAYFAGMPFPNFYPPLFYWIVAALHHIGLPFSFSFKLVVALPIIILPLAIWAVAKRIIDTDRLTAFFPAVISCILLTDHHFMNTPPLGLDYFSTFQIGLYTQPLGFVLLLLWFFVHINLRDTRFGFLLSVLLLSLVILANFFAAMTACIFLFAFLAYDLFIIWQEPDKQIKISHVRELAIKCCVPLLSFCLSSFWLVPMYLQSDYFVTRPSLQPALNLVPQFMWILYVLAICGLCLWYKKPTENKFIYGLTCVILFILCFILAPFMPVWFPFQSNRFLATLNFLLCIPAGDFIAHLVRIIEYKYLKKNLQPLEYVVPILVVIGLSVLLKAPVFDLAFYKKEMDERVAPILEFAADRKDGRYLVEVPDQRYPAAQLDGRAISAYLGSQGNEVTGVVFREASPNSIFFNPVINAFSAHPDSYGISSVLSDDLDFAEQPIHKHIERAKFIGVRYFVIISPWIKERLSRDQSIAHRYEIGAWTIYEIADPIIEKASVLENKPALLVSSFTVKGRKSDEISFFRLVEEQFNDAWFEVMLARSAEQSVDKLSKTDNFGALIVEKYSYEDIQVAFDKLLDYSYRNTLILIDDEDPLFKMIEDNKSMFPHLYILERPSEASGHLLSSEQPTTSYAESRIRTLWKQIRTILEQTKRQVERASVKSQAISSNKMTLNVSTEGEDIPILLRASFHPNWRREDHQPIYAVTPFFTLTFADRDFNFSY